MGFHRTLAHRRQHRRRSTLVPTPSGQLVSLSLVQPLRPRSACALVGQCSCFGCSISACRLPNTARFDHGQMKMLLKLFLARGTVSGSMRFRLSGSCGLELLLPKCGESCACSSSACLADRSRCFVSVSLLLACLGAEHGSRVHDRHSQEKHNSFICKREWVSQQGILTVKCHSNGRQKYGVDTQK